MDQNRSRFDRWEGRGRSQNGRFDRFRDESRWNYSERNDRGRNDWRESRVRDTIANVITGYSGRSSYDPYYGTPYSPNYYATNYYSYSTNYYNSPYYPSYYDSGYYNNYESSYYNYPDYSGYYDDSYPSYLTTSYYPVYSSYYDPYSFVYSSPSYQQYYDPYGVNYDDPYYGYNDPNSYYDDGYGTDYCSLASNGYWHPGSLADTLGKLVATGYDQGYGDGLSASYYNEDANYYNPYSYEDTSYDSYSYRLAENRQCLSQGYELGYQDALAGRGQYNPLYSGNEDLVSMLIGTALQAVNN